MKKVLIATLALLLIASSSFAGVNFLVAPGVGEGKYAVLGMYATNHQGNLANSPMDPQVFDANSLGVRGCYGVMKDVDLLAAYSMDTLPNVKDYDMKQEAGSTMGLGVKYTMPKSVLDLPVDIAGLFGYEMSSFTVKPDETAIPTAKSVTNLTTLGLGCIVSKDMGTYVPYGAIGYKMLTKTMDKKFFGYTIDDIGGSGLAWNIGVMIGIAQDQAVAIEYNTENISWQSTSTKGKKLDDASAVSVSGISLGYVYVF